LITDPFDKTAGKAARMTHTINFIHDTRFEDIPADMIHEAVRCLTDTLGVSVGGAQTDMSRIIRNHAARQFGGTGAHIWWDGRTASPAGAALANGMTIDALDAHDGYKPAKGHVGCGVIPGLIAVMEAEGRFDAKELLTSIVIGYEIGSRAGVALHASVSDYHTSGAWVALAVAALGARQLGLSKDQTREAVGIAEYHGPRSQMMRCIDAPTMVKDGSGWGAMAGVSAAYLAQDGFTGAPAITMDAPDLAHFWNDLGQNWLVAEQYIKLYPVCRWAQPPVEAMLALVKEHRFGVDDVAQITIETFHEGKRLNTIPNNTEEAQYSLPFAVAVALVRGTIGVNEVTQSGLSDPKVRAIAQSISIIETDEFNATFPAFRIARAIVKLKDGRVLTSADTEAKGDPEDKVSDAVLWSKFNDISVPIIGTENASALMNCIHALPEGGATNLLIGLLSG
jgi:2-methylcitrate dehydratase PrpD